MSRANTVRLAILYMTVPSKGMNSKTPWYMTITEKEFSTLYCLRILNFQSLVASALIVEVHASKATKISCGQSRGKHIMAFYLDLKRNICIV